MEIDDIETIAVLGAGNMGHGIAEVAALAGYDVTMRDINEEFVQDGYEQIEWSLEKLAEKDQISQADADGALELALHALEDASEGGLESEGMSASIVSGDGFRSVSDAELHEMIEGNGLAPDEESDEDDEE